MRHSRILGLATVLAGAAALAGCDATGPQLGTVNYLLTDAPGDSIASATVWISKVVLVGDSSQYAVDTSVSYDLLSLQNGVTALLGSTTVPVGTYEQLRLVVDSARVVLASGLTFANGDSAANLKVPSGMQTGIKVNFGGPIRVAPGQTDLVVDFDVSRSFVLTGPPTAPLGVIFKPVIHATVQNVAGSIAGTVTPAAAHAQVFAIAGSDTVASALADTTSGAYTLWYLAPGTYTVAAAASGYTGATQSVTVGAAQAVTGVDFTLTQQ